MAYTGVCTLGHGKLGLFYRYIQEKLGRSVFTHELATGVVEQEIKDAAKEDFLSICADAVPDDVLRSYGPMQKPLSLDELGTLEFPIPLWLEYMDRTILDGECVPEIVYGVKNGEIVLDNDEVSLEIYQKIFRYWLRRPTEAERTAASWEVKQVG